MVLQLRPRPVPLLDTTDIPLFEALLTRGFHMRRKTLWNNLRDKLPPEEAERLKGYLEANGVNLMLRPQDVDLRMWLKAFWVQKELANTG
jgi:16S rRNA A1518/A1519 N6-dimethyltransferase RsmA/KsgA/DIM1 with predicted DNA glycosylase/AP lyase activity